LQGLDLILCSGGNEKSQAQQGKDIKESGNCQRAEAARYWHLKYPPH